MGHGAILRVNDKRLIFRPNAQRFWEKVQTSDDCWIWTGARTKMGHGKFWVRHEDGSYQLYQAHRFAYELLIGPIPEGKILDHIECSNPPCVNPGHTEPTTHRCNILRGAGVSAVNARKTRCNYGHDFSAENTIWVTGRSGIKWRVCRQCTKKGQNK
jgi:hypothetical protein